MIQLPMDHLPSETRRQSQTRNEGMGVESEQNLMIPNLPEFRVHWLPGYVVPRQVSLPSASVGRQVPGG